MNRFALLGVIGLVLLCLFCPWCRAPGIEDDVRSAALTCAADAGLDPEQVSVSGRDVTLTGGIASQQAHDLVTSCISAFPGTRTVNDGLKVLAAGVLGFRTHYGDVSLWGVVPSEEAHSAIIDEAVELWGSPNVTDELEIDAALTIGGWSDNNFAQFMAILHHSRRDLDIELTGEQLARLDEVSAIQLGFPHDFLGSDGVRRVIYGNTHALIDNHRG